MREGQQTIARRRSPLSSYAGAAVSAALVALLEPGCGTNCARDGGQLPCPQITPVFCHCDNLVSPQLLELDVSSLALDQIQQLSLTNLGPGTIDPLTTVALDGLPPTFSETPSWAGGNRIYYWVPFPPTRRCYRFNISTWIVQQKVGSTPHFEGQVRGGAPGTGVLSFAS